MTEPGRGPQYHPTRGNLLIRDVDTADTIPDGRIHLLEDTRTRFSRIQALVVAVGPPAWDEEEEREIPMAASPGDWVLLRSRFCRVATEDPTLFVIRGTDLAARLEER